MIADLAMIARLALAFGRVNRATYHPDGERPESDTDHTVMLGLLAIHLAGLHPEWGLDVGRLAVLALVHDFPEVHALDTDTIGGLSAEAQADKARREAVAVEQLRRELGDTPILWAIRMYESRECAESRFLAYLDKLTPRLTNILDRGAAVRKRGRDAAWLHSRHVRQDAELAAMYPEFAVVLGLLFEAAGRAAEAALAAPPRDQKDS